MRGREQEKGITLIALIVTIIVLLILAGLSIAMLFGDGGLLHEAVEAERQHGKAVIIELAQQEILDWYSDHTGDVITEEVLEGILSKYGKISEEEDLSILDKSIDTKHGEIKVSEIYRHKGKLGGSGGGAGGGTTVGDVLKDFKENPSKYQKPATQEETDDVGIGEDGTIIDMDLWNYEISDEENGYFKILGTPYGSGFSAAFTFIKEGSGYRGIEIIDESDEDGDKICTFTGGLPTYLRKDNKYYTLNSLDNGALAGNDSGSCWWNLQEIGLKLKVDIPSTVKKLECTYSGDAYQGIFWSNRCLKEVNIPDGVVADNTDIAGMEYCTSLKSFNIPEGYLNDIYSGFFSYCTSLEYVVLPKSVKSIPSSGFINCTALKTIYYRGSQDEWNEIAITDGCEYFDNAKKVFDYSD